MPAPDDLHEVARRLRAAMAYAGLERVDVAELLNVSVPAVARMTGRKGNEIKPTSWDDRWKVARACGLPPEWFSADFDRLHAIVPAGMPTVVKPGDAGAIDDTMAQRAIAAAEAGPHRGRTRRAARRSARASGARKR